jgi:hypothetical protein
MNNEQPLTAEDVRQIVRQELERALTGVGLNTDDQAVQQADLIWLHEMRTTTQSAVRHAVTVAMGLIVTGLIGAVWAGVKFFLGGK